MAEHDPRPLCTRLRFWRVCARKGCRRAHACTGDAQACFARWWPVVPDEVKVMLRAAAEAQRAGLSKDDINAMAGAALRRWQADHAAPASGGAE